jgi:hypothetical protein
MVAEGEKSSRDFADWSLACSGSALFVEREIERIRAAARTEPQPFQRDLLRLLEFPQFVRVSDGHILFADEETPHCSERNRAALAIPRGAPGT